MITRRISVVGAAALAITLAAIIMLAARDVPVDASTKHSSTAALESVAATAESWFPNVSAATAPEGSGIGLVDPNSGVWHLRTRAGDPTTFYFGNPGDVPMVGDWDCDGIDTPGQYRQSDGFVYLRNSNTQGVADIRFFFGNPGDIPLAGDFDNDGCDTVSIYRPQQGRVYIINELGTGNGGLGGAEYFFEFGNPGDLPFTGDFDGDGTTTVGLHRESTGLVYLRNSNSAGVADVEFVFGNPGDRVIAGDWTNDGRDTPAAYRPRQRTVYLRYSNTAGQADEGFSWGNTAYIPVSGTFGNKLTSGVTVNVSGAPDGLAFAIESFYQELPTAPHLPPGLRSHLGGLHDRPKTMAVSGVATTATAHGLQIAAVTAGADVLLAVSDDGWEWRIVGTHAASQGRAAWYGDSPRFVALIGADWQQNGDGSWPQTPLRTHADSVHLFTTVPASGSGTLLGIPRDTIVKMPDGERKVSKTMQNSGPKGTVDALARETGLPIEGYLHTGFGSSIGGGDPPPGYVDLVDAYGGFPFWVPYNVPANGSVLQAGSDFVELDGADALAFARERRSIAHGDVDRTLGQGLLIKAAIAEVRKGSVLDAPGLVALTEGFINTDLSVDDLLTLAATIYPINPGAMPTLTGPDLAAAGHTSGASINSSHGPYNQNVGTLPNVMVKGCWQPWTDPDTGIIESGAWRLHPNNYATFADLRDGTLTTVPWSC